MSRQARPEKPAEPTWAVYMLGGNRAHRLGTVAAPDKDAAIAKAIEFFGITDPERQKRVAVSPMG
jgi:Ser/Thr protein kinase RdoA (MazF antagonist)